MVIQSIPEHKALIELCVYPKSLNFNRILDWFFWIKTIGVLEPKSRIMSRSFSPKFLKGLGALLRLELDKDKLVIKVPTLDRMGFIEILGSSIASKFRPYLDDLGAVALAFWVDSLESLSDEEILAVEGVETLTPIFKLDVLQETLEIRFVKIGGVIIELLTR